MNIENQPSFIIAGIINTFLLFLFGGACDELMIHFLPGPSTLRLLMSFAKGFSYIGAGLMGMVTTMKWLQSIWPKVIKKLKNTKIYKYLSRWI